MFTSAQIAMNECYAATDTHNTTQQKQMNATKWQCVYRNEIVVTMSSAMSSQLRIQHHSYLSLTSLVQHA